MLPVIAEVVLVENLELRIGPIGKPQVAKVHLGRRDDTRAIGILFEVFGRADDQTADDELVLVAVGPPKGGLEHLMKLREVEVAGQLQRAADNRIDPEDLSFEPDDKVIAIKAFRHAGIMPLQSANGKLASIGDAGDLPPI